MNSNKALASEALALSSIIVRCHEQLSGNVDGEAVLLRMEDGQYFRINAIGTHIWDSIAQPLRVSAVIEQLQARYEVDRSTCEAELLSFLRHLQSARLLSIVQP